MEPVAIETKPKKSLPQGMDKKLKSVLQEISTSSDKIKAKMTHVAPVVQTKMPQKLENELCVTYKSFPVSYDYICPRFDVNDPAGYKHLEDYGYVVFKNIIPSQSEIEDVKNQIWDWLEKLPFPNDVKIDRTNPETWHDGIIKFLHSTNSITINLRIFTFFIHILYILQLLILSKVIGQQIQIQELYFHLVLDRQNLCGDVDHIQVFVKHLVQFGIQMI